MLKRRKYTEKIKSKSYDEFLSAFKKQGCPICILSFTGINGYFGSILDESVNDPLLRKKLRESLGFCKNHSAQFIDYVENSHNRLGASIIVEDLAKESIKKIEKLNKKIVGIKNKKIVCLACSHKESLERIYTREFANFLDCNDFYNSYLENSILCHEHFSGAIKIIKNKDITGKVIRDCEIKLGKNIDLVNCFIKKNDYKNKENISAEEAEAWKKIIKIIKGL